MRAFILGNSGSGKTTLARWIADRWGAAVLDLDTVAWEPDRIAVRRDRVLARDDVLAFCRRHEHWVIEGCYADLLEACFEFQPTLIFLNPGPEVCMDHCRARPWEPHKYSSKEEQDQRLEFLLSWVRDYYHRDDEISLVTHRSCFDRYPGPKRELTSRMEWEPPPAELMKLLAQSPPPE